MARRLTSHLTCRFGRPLAAALATVLAGPSPAPAQPGSAPERRFALLVAHADGGPGTETLQYVRRDTQKVTDVLAEMGGFASGDVQVLLDPGAAEVTAALQALDRRIGPLARAGQPTLLLFYYSGHGGGGALRLGGTRLPMADLQATLRASPAGIRLAFLDACASGELTRLKGGTKAASFVDLRVDAPPEATGYVVITSSRHDEASQESDDLRGSFFTHALVSGLRGAGDRNGDAAVTLTEAYDYAYHRTVSRTAETRGGTQHPTYTYDLRGDGAVVLTRLAGQGFLDFSAAGPGSYLVYDPTRDVVVAEVEQAITAGQEPGGSQPGGGSIAEGQEPGGGSIAEGQEPGGSQPGGREAGLRAINTPRRLSVRPGVYLVKKRAPEHVLLESVVVPGAGGVGRVEESRFTRVAFEDDATKGPDALARARVAAESRPWLYLGAGFGYQSFFDRPTRDTLFHPTPLLAVRAELPGLIAGGQERGGRSIVRRVGVHLDAAIGQSTYTFDVAGYPHAADFGFGLAGVGLDFDLPAGPVLFQVGPRLSGIYAWRTFTEPGAPPAQDLFTFSPGAEAALRWPLDPMRVGLTGRVHYLRYATETEDRSLGFGEAYVTLEYAP